MGMKRPIGAAFALMLFGAPVQAQFVKLQQVPYTPEEALDAVEQVMGVRPASLDGLKVVKYRLPIGGTRLSIEWESKPRLLEAAVCLKRQYRLQRDSGTGDSQAEDRRTDFAIQPMVAEVAGDAETCAGATHWIGISRNLVQQPRPLRFPRQLREWVKDVSRDDFCKLVPGKLDACMNVWPVVAGDKPFKNVTLIEYFPILGVEGGPAFSYRFTYKAGPYGNQHASRNIVFTAAKDGTIVRITSMAVASSDAPSSTN